MNRTIHPLTGRHVFLMFLVFFAIILAANIFMVWMAYGTFNGLSEENAYEKGLAWNEQIERQKQQMEAQWAASVAYDSQKGQFTVQLSDREGPVSDSRATINLIRPVHTGSDESAPLMPGAVTGTYTADLRPTLPGQWDVLIRAERKGQTFETLSRIDLPGR